MTFSEVTYAKYAVMTRSSIHGMPARSSVSNAWRYIIAFAGLNAIIVVRDVRVYKNAVHCKDRMAKIVKRTILQKIPKIPKALCMKMI